MQCAWTQIYPNIELHFRFLGTGLLVAQGLCTSPILSFSKLYFHVWRSLGLQSLLGVKCLVVSPKHWLKETCFKLQRKVGDIRRFFDVQQQVWLSYLLRPCQSPASYSATSQGWKLGYNAFFRRYLHYITFRHVWSGWLVVHNILYIAVSFSEIWVVKYIW